MENPVRKVAPGKDHRRESIWVKQSLPSHWAWQKNDWNGWSRGLAWAIHGLLHLHCYVRQRILCHIPFDKLAAYLSY